VQLCAFKHRNSPFELFFTKYGFDIGLMNLHEILLFSRSEDSDYILSGQKLSNKNDELFF
jgi:hypothetical protein